MIIATVPAPYRAELVQSIASHPYVDAVRFNVGARSNVPPLYTLLQLRRLAGEKDLWIDLKGRQLRIKEWGVPTYGDIVLNHKVVIHPSPENRIIFRDGTREGFSSHIVSAQGNRVFIDPPPENAVGAGQAVNIHAKNMKIYGYLTGEDKAYIEAAKKLGLKNFMLSFVEEPSDYLDILKEIPDANLVLKIESPKGLELLDRVGIKCLPNVHLMVARDDLLTNLEDRSDIIPATRYMLDLDPETIVASRILISLLRQSAPSLGDIADLTLLKESGCRNLMLCDDLSTSPAFAAAMDYLAERW